MSVFTIPALYPYWEHVAQGVLDRFGADPVGLARGVVVLPSKRACRMMRDSLLAVSANPALLLPTLLPFDTLHETSALWVLKDSLTRSLLTHLPPMARRSAQMVLAQLIHATTAHTQAQVQANVAAAVNQAGELTALIEQLDAANVPFEVLKTIVPDHLTAHWQHTLRFLCLVGEHWPRITEERQQSDPLLYRNLCVRLMACALEQTAHPFVVAGLTCRTPLEQAFLTRLASCQAGYIILPPLDPHQDETAYDPAHPQWLVQNWLKQAGFSAAAIPPWYAKKAEIRCHPERSALLSLALVPAARSIRWQQMPSLTPEATQGVTLIPCTTQEEEAQVVSLILREQVEHCPEERVALVTYDRALARRVTHYLAKWGITVDDAAGQRLACTPLLVFMRLVLQYARDPQPSTLLSLLKATVLTAGGNPSHAAFTATLEHTFLRHWRGELSLTALLSKIQTRSTPETGEWFAAIIQYLRPFCLLFAQASQPLVELIESHLRLTEAWLTTAHPAFQSEDRVRVWEMLGQLMQEPAARMSVHPWSYPALFDTLLRDELSHTPLGFHSRITVATPQDARFDAYDTVVLGAVNEEVWPGKPAGDRWLSPSMRKELGLPLDEAGYGTDALTFYCLSHAPRVFYTYARKRERVPALPSRWLLRLQTVLAKGGQPHALCPGINWQERAHRLSHPTSPPAPFPPPAPCPPVAIRPTQFSVTEIERFMVDPYTIYAKRILQLSPLLPLEAKASKADFGTLLHRLADHLARHYTEWGNDDVRYAALHREALAYVRSFAEGVLIPFWLERIEAIILWLLTFEARCREGGGGVTVTTEHPGHITLDIAGLSFTLTAKADRLEVVKGGVCRLLDFKTGVVPSAKAVERGHACQLPLQGLIALRQGFAGQTAGALYSVAGLAYVKLTGGGTVVAEVKPLREEPAILVEQARGGVTELLTVFNYLRTAYRYCPRAEYEPSHTDYGHLARVQEWRNTA